MLIQKMANSEEQFLPEARRFFIDALNVAYWCGNPPSLRLPMTLMTRLLSDGHPVQMYFDASARYTLTDEADLYGQLMQHPQHCIEVPSGRSADAVMLRFARSSGACMLSRDKYRDHRKRYRKLIDDPSRLMSGFVKEDCLVVPSLALNAPLPSSAQQAWGQLKALLANTQ